MVSFTPRPLYPQGNRPRYPLDRRLGGPRVTISVGHIALIFFSEVGGNIFLQKVGTHLPEYMASILFIFDIISSDYTNIESRIIRWLINDELERIWKEVRIY
jgi:hypothetical protein